MTRICALISRARTEYGIEIVNLKPTPVPLAKRAKSKKRSHEDDIPDDVKTEGALMKEYKNLAAHLKCEAHKGHCYINRNAEHKWLDYMQMSYWAKKMVLGEADENNPPNILSMDRQPI